jgi:hypothetical protein
MPTMETDRNRSDWDPAVWSIVTTLGVAIVYVACLV